MLLETLNSISWTFCPTIGHALCGVHESRTTGDCDAFTGRESASDLEAIGDQLRRGSQSLVEDLPQAGDQRFGVADTLGDHERAGRTVASGDGGKVAGTKDEGAAHKNADQGGTVAEGRIGSETEQSEGNC